MLAIHPCSSSSFCPFRLVCFQHDGLLQVQVALAVAAQQQQQQQHAHSNGGHHGSLAMPATATLNAGQASDVTAASVRFCQQCSQAHGSHDFPSDPQQPDGVSRLCQHCLRCRPYISVPTRNNAPTPSFTCRSCAHVFSIGMGDSSERCNCQYRAGVLGELRPAAVKYCGSCYETKPQTEFAGGGEYCRCAASTAPGASHAHDMLHR